MRTNDVPAAIQAVGLACVPLHDMPAGEKALARRPVAAAVLTLQRRSDGHREIVAAAMSDARDSEFPLPWLIDRALMPIAPTIITPNDRALLEVEAMARRHWAEPTLADLCDGAHTIDPRAMMGETVGDEAALCRRLQIPAPLVSDVDVERTWGRHAPETAMDVAMGQAVARLMLWAHARAFAAGEPDGFYETLPPLRDWMQDEEARWPSLRAALRSRPIARAASFAAEYRTYRDARDGGDPTATWATFEDGLFHV